LRGERTGGCDHELLRDDGFARLRKAKREPAEEQNKEPHCTL
jgi:hypothetical protein